MTLHFLNEVVNDTESIQKSMISDFAVIASLNSK